MSARENTGRIICPGHCPLPSTLVKSSPDDLHHEALLDTLPPIGETGFFGVKVEGYRGGWPSTVARLCCPKAGNRSNGGLV